jgi:hypothetical protein
MWGEDTNGSLEQHGLRGAKRRGCRLALIGVGLLAYAVWRFCSAVYDTIIVAAAMQIRDRPLYGPRHNPGEVRGLEAALDTLASQSFGPWLLAVRH